MRFGDRVDKKDEISLKERTFDYGFGTSIPATEERSRSFDWFEE